MPPPLDVPAAVERARRLQDQPGRRLLGIAGAPGSGKSTLARAVAAALGRGTVVVPMDGFHLTDEELARVGRSAWKGAPDTFDARGYVHLLRRLRSETAHTVYAPRFDRQREEAVAGAIAVRPEHRLVVTEGNYLLLQTAGWEGIRALLDDVWYVEVDEKLRVERLVRRHVEHGRTPTAAEEWVERSDQANARLVEATKGRADVLVGLG